VSGSDPNAADSIYSRVTGEMGEALLQGSHVHGRGITPGRKRSTGRLQQGWKPAGLAAQPASEPLNYALSGRTQHRRAQPLFTQWRLAIPVRTGDGNFGPNVNRLVDGIIGGWESRHFSFANPASRFPGKQSRSTPGNGKQRPNLAAIPTRGSIYTA